MTETSSASSEYLKTLLRYYEDEIRGEAYFFALAEHYEERDKVILLGNVEREGQLAILRDLNCQYGQGYLYSPALAFVEMNSLLLEWNPGKKFGALYTAIPAITAAVGPSREIRKQPSQPE